jgi:hypothetical protein
LWTVTAILCASRGFDTSDEGFYLLAYRWWNVNFDTFTGAQYFYGPVFDLLGHNVAELRVFKVVTLLAAHATFGWHFMCWLRLRRPQAPTSLWWEASGTAAIVASAGIVYSWLPLSPGYNDLSLTCAMLAAGVALRMARTFEVSATTSWWTPIAMGGVAVVMVLNKWSSALLSFVVITIALAVVALALRLSWPTLARVAGFMILGMLGSLAIVNFVLVPLGKLVPPMLEVNSLVAGSSNSPTALLSLYWTSAVALLRDILQQQGVLLLAAVVVPSVRRRQGLAVTFAVLGLGVATAQVVRNHGLQAGSHNLPSITVSIFTPLLAMTVAAVAVFVSARVDNRKVAIRHASRRQQICSSTVFAMLVTLPIAQAAGTGNPVHFIAMTCLGLWVAAAIGSVTSIPAAARGARVLVAGTLALLILATSLIAVDGLWNHPYRTTGHDASTARVPGVPALSSLRLEPTAARRYSALHAQLKPFIQPPGRAMMAFDGLSGIVLLLDGRPVGEAWYAANSPRPTAGIRRACAQGEPWWGDRKPLVIFNRQVTSVERRALRTCHLSLRDDYSAVEAGGLLIYLPKDGDVPCDELKEIYPRQVSRDAEC